MPASKRDFRCQHISQDHRHRLQLFAAPTKGEPLCLDHQDHRQKSLLGKFYGLNEIHGKSLHQKRRNDPEPPVFLISTELLDSTHEGRLS